MDHCNDKVVLCDLHCYYQQVWMCLCVTLIDWIIQQVVVQHAERMFWIRLGHFVATGNVCILYLDHEIVGPPVQKILNDRRCTSTRGYIAGAMCSPSHFGVL